MACTPLSIPTSTTASTTKCIFIEHNGLHQSNSSRNLYKRASVRRSFSDNQICYCVKPIHASSTQPKLKSSRSMGIFPFQLSGSILPNSLKSFLFDPETSKDMNVTNSNVEECNEEKEIKRVHWVERLLEIRSHWKNRQHYKDVLDEDEANFDDKEISECGHYGEEFGNCVVSYSSSEEENEEVTYDSESFSRFLVKVTWSTTKLFSQLAFLCNIAYMIPDIQAKDLKKYFGLQFVTSSLEKKAEVDTKKLEKLNQDMTTFEGVASLEDSKSNLEKSKGSKMRPSRISIAYEIAASAASYVQTCTKDMLSLNSTSIAYEEKDNINGQDLREIGEEPTQEEGESSTRVPKSEVAAYMAAKTMTAVVAAGEKERLEAAKNLQSLHSSPCEWFICDDSSTYTRCFVIQGSDSLASWQANLFFEPTKFEDSHVLVHRGIYEAAKGIYQQFMPEIMEHLYKHGERAKIQFTGHSLGGSLSLLVHLMLLTRKVVKPSTLRPIVTFGSPFVFCGGQKILEELGLDENLIHSVIMHRDIVPRAFSCNYPNHVATVLKRLNSSFRTHPCLNKNKLLYSPLGKLFIVQPDDKFSPPHPLLPPGSALYALDNTHCGFCHSVLKAFLNNPHPLETLSDPTAYGSEGTILRDHDSSNYLKAVNGVLRRQTKMVVKESIKERNQFWPLLAAQSPHSWTHESNMENRRLGSQEIMSRV